MENNQKKLILIIAASVVVLLLLIGAVFLGIHLSKDEKDGGNTTPSSQVDMDTEGQEYEGNKGLYEGEKNTDTIDIPGFDSMTFKAGEKKQSVNIYNPEQNTCYFKATLYLPDGTVLWESKMIAPGKAVYEIELSKALDIGEYKNAKLKYDCFKLDGTTPLNGAEIKLTINIIK